MKKYIYFLSVVVSVLLVSGCAGNRSYGRFTPSRAVEKEFKSFDISTDYNYYYNGRARMPDAIIGIRKNYVMESKFWHPVALDSEKMAVWWETLRHEWFNGMGAPLDFVPTSGWELVSPSGRDAGILFSKYSRVVAEFSAGNSITVSVPQPGAGVYDRRWGRDR